MLKLYEDRRIGGVLRLYLSEKRDDSMLVPPEVRECVAFLCCRTQNRVFPAGTGFFMSMPAQDESITFVYIITARHVIEGIARKSLDNKVLLRLNRRAGDTNLIETDVPDWRFHPIDSSADVAALAYAPDTAVYKYRALPKSMLVTRELIEEHSIGPGDEVFFPGLFVNHVGHLRNLPLVRIGNIAAMPEERVNTADGPIDAYLVEARSIGGLSGSPVLVHLLLGRGGSIDLGQARFYLLGLMHGHFDSPLTEADEPIERENQTERVNMGIAIVVPSEKIAEVLDHPHFILGRQMTEEARRQNQQPTPD